MQQARYLFCFILVCVLARSPAATAPAQDKDYFVYFGTYTGFRFVRHSKTQGVGESHSKGIYVSRFNAATGALSEPELAAESINPSFLTISPNHRFVYAVNEDPLSVGPPLDHASYVSAFAIDPATGKLRLLNTRSYRRNEHLLHLHGQDRQICVDGQFRKWKRFRNQGQGRRLAGGPYLLHPERGAQRKPCNPNRATSSFHPGFAGQSIRNRV